MITTRTFDAVMFPPHLSTSGRGTKRDAREVNDAMTTTDGEERGGTFLQVAVLSSARLR